MNMDNLRLPASELAKLQPARARANPAGVLRTPSTPVAVSAAALRRPRPVRHLSGFARA